MQYCIISALIIAVIGVYGQEEINCRRKDEYGCSINETCSFLCKYHCCDVSPQIAPVTGSGTYLFNSSICRSALHDLRFPPLSSSSKQSRAITIRRFRKENCSLEGSVRYGFSSNNFQNASCDVFEFVNSRVSEHILDLVSMHTNYLYKRNKNHIQMCLATLEDSEQHIKFGIYSKWEQCKNSINAEKNFKGKYAIWSGTISGGFQCFINGTALSTITSIAFQEDASFLPKSLTITVNKHDNVDLSMEETHGKPDQDTEWKKDSKEILMKPNDRKKRTLLTLNNVHEGSSGIYSLSYKDGENILENTGFIQLIVRTCHQDKYGDDCSKTCQSCLNGGICHDITGECVCAPGFNGSNCENACEPGYLGKMCSIKCVGNASDERQLCKGLLICLPSPYGCSCGSGFRGLNCDKECPDKFYGAGCLQQHKQVYYKIGSCNRFNDSCECLNDWHGSYCNESFPAFSKPPSLLNVTKNSITLSFSKWSDITDEGSGNPVFYEVVYKEIGDGNWTKGEKVSAENENETFQVQLKPLKPAIDYTVGVIVIDSSGNKQVNIKTVNTTTACDTPSEPPSDIELNSKDQNVSVQWKFPSKENWNCRKVNITVKVRESFTNSTKECRIKENSCSFYSDPFSTWIIKVCATSDGNNENCAMPEMIKVKGIYNLSSSVEIIKRERSLYLHWKPPEFTRKLKYYCISHEDKNTNTSISVPIYTKDSVCNDNKGNYHCYTIDNLIPGHVYEIKITAFYFNFEEGHLIKCFVERLENPSVALSAILGVCLPLLLIICIIALILCMQKHKKIKSALTVKFFSYKMESEFAACNEALDEMDIIETESISEEVSNPIKLKELPEYVKQSIQNVKIRKEFMSVPTGQIYPCNAAKLGENKPKNRYGNILPYDHSRVVLDIVDGDPFSDYIHANYIHGFNKEKKFIATQGPLPNTVNDFWRMLWNEGSCKILMITNFMENGKYKCEKYWTEAFYMYGDITVSLEDSKSYADFIIRTFKVSKDKISREVKQFHFTTWPDHGAPSNVTPFGSYLRKARSYKPECNSPIIIHCSAGIGRTGTTILLDSMVDMALQEKQVDLVSHLCSMRKQRMNIVENFDQYVFVYCALVDCLCFEDNSIKLTDFKKEFERLKTIDKASEITFIGKQFQELNQRTANLMYKDVLGAYQQENQSKNRSMLVLPPDRARPILSRDSSAYINAVYVDSFTVKNAYIATQYPLPETVHDFWSMIYEQKSRTVILFQEVDSSKEKIPPLWLPEGIQAFGNCEVTCQSVTSENEMTVVNIVISIKDEDMKQPLSVNIIILKQWAFDNTLPVETSVILSAISKVHSLNSESNIITTVCPDGVSACGVLCACLYIYDHIKVEQEIDILHAVKCIRTNRPHFILNLAQYEFLFNWVSLYLDSSS